MVWRVRRERQAGEPNAVPPLRALCPAPAPLVGYVDDSERFFLYRGTSRNVDFTASAEMTVSTIDGP